MRPGKGRMRTEGALWQPCLSWRCMSFHGGVANVPGGLAPASGQRAACSFYADHPLSHYTRISLDGGFWQRQSSKFCFFFFQV